MGYNDEILKIRQERAQRDINEAINVIQERYVTAAYERDAAAAQGDASTFEAWDRECEQLEDEYQSVAPPPPPQAPTISGPTQAYLNERQAFNQRYGAAAVHAYKAAHALAVQSGLQVDTPDYFKFCDDALELHGKDFNGTRFDPSEKVPHANEICRITGVSADEYNRQWRRMHAEGRDSGSQQRQQFSRKIG
jgi:hypothetical protein